MRGGSQAGMAPPPEKHRIRIEGWYSQYAAYPNIDRYLLDPKIFKYGVRIHYLEDLVILPIERIQGSFFTPTEVVGVMNLDVKENPNPSTPFFIEKKKVKELKKLIERYVPDKTLYL
jgi:hypothetical protein